MDSMDEVTKKEPEESGKTDYSIAPLLTVAREILQVIRSIKGMTGLINKKQKRELVWLTSNETLELLKISKRTLERYRLNKKIRYYKFKGQRRYKYLDVTLLMDKNQNLDG